MTSQPNDIKELPENGKGMRRCKKTVTVVLCVVMALILLTVASVGYVWYSGKMKMIQRTPAIKPGDGFTAIVNSDNTVVYEGKVYRYNENVTAVLCMGVDNDKKTSGGVAVTGRAGQADALYLIAIDTSNGKSSVIGIPRDTICDIDIYSKSGGYIGVEQTQICLAFAYGDGKKQSCENTVKAVSRLLYGMPVNSYFSVDNKSIPALHNAVGKITVVPNETVSNGNMVFKKGVPTVLTGSNVFQYLQARNQENVNASYLRMERQLDYIKKYGAAVIEKTKNNILFPVELYKKVQKNAITNVDVTKIAYLATAVVNNKSDMSVEYISIEGEQIKGDDGYAEFYPDEKKLFETVLQVYYVQEK